MILLYPLHTCIDSTKILEACQYLCERLPSVGRMWGVPQSCRKALSYGLPRELMICDLNGQFRLTVEYSSLY